MPISDDARELLKGVTEKLHQSLDVSALFGTATRICHRLTGPIRQFFGGMEFSDASHDEHHDDITQKVYRRLLLRHSVIEDLENITREHEVHKVLLAEKDNSKEQIQEASIRCYNLAITDIFVEKALAYLSRKARAYNRLGFVMFAIAFFFIYRACANAYTALDPTRTDSFVKQLAGVDSAHIWTYSLSMFIKSFTYYGLMILVAAYSGRIAKALFDQAERIKDKRHALRQGRLFVHLHGGKLDLEEMDKAFSWNATHENAFNSFNPEASAPLGMVVKEFSKTMSDFGKSVVETIQAFKKG